MKRTSLPILGDISVIGLGAGPFGSEIDETTAHELLDGYLAAGGNFIDTAHIYGAWDPRGVNGGYGNSEVTIGRWMKSRGCRDRVIVATKGGHPDFETGESRLTREWVRRQLEESLERLQTDHIDLYLLHRDDRNLPVAEILAWLREAVATGSVRAVGCSNWRTDRFLEAREVARAQSLPMPITNQIAWSLAHQESPLAHDKFGEQVAMDVAMWDSHRRTGIPVTAYQSQAGGLFAALDKVEAGTLSLPDIPKPGLLKRYGNDLTHRRHRMAQSVARRHACTSQQIALAWLLHQPFPTIALVGPRRATQLHDSLHALEINLSGDEVQRLRQGFTSPDSNHG